MFHADSRIPHSMDCRMNGNLITKVDKLCAICVAYSCRCVVGRAVELAVEYVMCRTCCTVIIRGAEVHGLRPEARGAPRRPL